MAKTKHFSKIPCYFCCSSFHVSLISYGENTVLWWFLQTGVCNAFFSSSFKQEERLFMLILVLPLKGLVIPFLPFATNTFPGMTSLLENITDDFSYNPWNPKHAGFMYHAVKQGNSKLDTFTLAFIPSTIENSKLNNPRIINKKEVQKACLGKGLIHCLPSLPHSKNERVDPTDSNLI